MNYNQKRAQALTRFRRGQPAEAARLFAEALAEKETSEGWNDWATAQVAAGASPEAEAGYERALELNPNNPEALVNLAVLRAANRQFTEALALLARVPPALQPAAVQALLAQCRQHAVPGQEIARWYESLRALADQKEPQSDFDAHFDFYAAALQLLPQATPGQRLLELRAGFRPLSSSLRKLKEYEVSCAQLGDEPARSKGSLNEAAAQGEHPFPDYTFDFELAPWPFADACFDVVLACQVLEHLARDPMLVLQEINRVLKNDGFLLLTAANIASARSIAKVLRGESPYLSGQYLAGGNPRDRHNREYTPNELERILACAGFGDVHLQTRNRRGLPHEESVLRSLLALNVPIGRRGDNMLVLARKCAGVKERYPVELYRLSEAQAGRNPGDSGKPELYADPAPHVIGHDPMHEGNCAAVSLIAATTAGREKILIVSETIAGTESAGADRWLTEVIRILHSLGHPLTYASRADSEGGKIDPMFSALGVEMCAGMAASAERFAGLLRHRGFDIVMLVQDFTSGVSIPERYLDEIRRESPATKIILLTPECFSNRERRRAEITGLLSEEERAAGLAQREGECFRAADLVLTVSEDARQALQQLDPDLSVDFFPIPAVPLPSTPGLNERRDVLLLADPAGPADPDFQWFRTEIWPRVRRALPGVKLHVAGIDLPESATVARMEGILSLGNIAEPGTVFSRYRLLVSPLRLATRNPVLLALASGIPVVTTSAGTEGLEVTDGTQVLVADSAIKFAAAVARVYNDAELWQRLVDNGRAHLEHTFSPQRAQQRMASALQFLCNTSPETTAERHRWSAREVETFEPRILGDESLTPAQRITLRMHAYAEYAQHLLGEHRPAEACEQLRHIFAFVRGPLPRHHFFANVLALLERCYRELGKSERGLRCGHEAILFLPEFNLKPAQGVRVARGKNSVSEFTNPSPVPAVRPLEL